MTAFTEFLMDLTGRSGAFEAWITFVIILIIALIALYIYYLPMFLTPHGKLLYFIALTFVGWSGVGWLILLVFAFYGRSTEKELRKHFDSTEELVSFKSVGTEFRKRV